MANSFDTEREPLEIETIAQLANHIVYRLPGCADEEIRRALQSSYADFCRASCVLTNSFVIDFDECGRRHHNDNQYDGHRFLRDLPDWRDGFVIGPSRPGRVVDFVKSVEHRGRTLVQGRDYWIRDGRIYFRHLWRGHVLVTTVEVPTSGSESAPRWLLAKYGYAIESGALARLMSMTGKAWSDASQAKMEAVTFNDAITAAKYSYYQGGEMSNGGVWAVGTGGLL